METLSKKELRLLCDIFTDKYRAAAPSKPLAQYIQQEIFIMTGVLIPKYQILTIKPFKKIVKKSCIHKGRTIKVLRKRNRH